MHNQRWKTCAIPKDIKKLIEMEIRNIQMDKTKFID
jgi:hypothetical protein